MKILMIAPEHPYPTDNGSKRRIRAVLEYFSARHLVTLVSLRESPGGTTQTLPGDKTWVERTFAIQPRKAKQMVQSLLSPRSYRQIKFWHPEMAAVIRQTLEQEAYDVVWVHILSSVRFLEGWWEKLDPKPLLVLDQHNLYSTFWESFIQRSTNPLIRLFGMVERNKSQTLQSRWFPRFDLIAAVSQQDLEDSRTYQPEGEADLHLTPNGVDLDYFSPRREKKTSTKPGVIFTGSMDATMNQQAVFWFRNQVWGTIKNQLPDCQFMIVGRNPTLSVSQLTREEDIMVTGTVPDVREYFDRADAAVIPIHLGGGTKLKILEALAMEVPVVSTTAGARGVAVQNGVHCWLADAPDQFAARVIEVLREPRRAREIAKAGRQLVEERYSWRSILSSLETALKLMLKENLGRTQS